jgi:hypothetical protein
MAGYSASRDSRISRKLSSIRPGARSPIRCRSGSVTKFHQKQMKTIFWHVILTASQPGKISQTNGFGHTMEWLEQYSNGPDLQENGRKQWKKNDTRKIIKPAKRSIRINVLRYSNRHNNGINFKINFDLAFLQDKDRTTVQNSMYPFIEILVKSWCKRYHQFRMLNLCWNTHAWTVSLITSHKLISELNQQFNSSQSIYENQNYQITKEERNINCTSEPLIWPFLQNSKSTARFSVFIPESGWLSGMEV